MPNALLKRPPQKRSAVRWPSSLRLYHFDSRKSAPGKKAASTKPRKKRVRRAPKKLRELQYQVGENKRICAYFVVKPDHKATLSGSNDRKRFN